MCCAGARGVPITKLREARSADVTSVTIRWAFGSLVRMVFGKRSISIRGEADALLRFRPAEYPTLLRGGANVDPRIRGQWPRLLRPDEVILDVGANIGFTVQRFYAILGGQCDIWAFEPMPRNLELLTTNVNALESDRISVVPNAVGDRDGTVLFCDNTKHGALSRPASFLRVSNERWPLYWKRYSEVEVSMITLDTFLANQADVRPTFVKIDVEGSGTDVLAGAGDMLNRYKPALDCEFHGPDEQAGMTRVLKEAGYRGIAFHEDGHLSWCDPGEAKANFVHPSDPRVPGLKLTER